MQTKSQQIEKKQTAANNQFLRKVKTLMNGPTYKATLAIVNSEGETAARQYLQQFFNRPINDIFPA